MGKKTDINDINITIKEDADKCCLIIPIDVGIKIIGIFCIVNAINVAWTIVTWLDSFIFAVVAGIIGVPILNSGFLFIKFFQKDSSETRADLPKACVFVAFSVIASIVWMVLYWNMLYSNNNRNHYNGHYYYRPSNSDLYGAHVGPNIFMCVIYLYFAGICKRFAKQ